MNENLENLKIERDKMIEYQFELERELSTLHKGTPEHEELQEKIDKLINIIHNIRESINILTITNNDNPKQG